MSLKAADQEAVLLASAIADFIMTEELPVAGEVALGVRDGRDGRDEAHERFLRDRHRRADATLATLQGEYASPPATRKQATAPAQIAVAIQTIKGTSHDHSQLVTLMPAVQAAIEQLQSLAITVSQQAVGSHNALVAYVQKLEEEMRTHWWVVGGWSGASKKLFSEMEITIAALQAGLELVTKNPAPLGLHAAPALLNLVLERGREEIPEMAIGDIVGGVGLSWRKKNYQEFSASPNAALCPMALMFGLSGEADDADDWKAAYSRKTGIDPKATISPLNFALQVYRERILRQKLKI